MASEVETVEFFQAQCLECAWEGFRRDHWAQAQSDSDLHNAVKSHRLT